MPTLLHLDQGLLCASGNYHTYRRSEAEPKYVRRAGRAPGILSPAAIRSDAAPLRA